MNRTGLVTETHVHYHDSCGMQIYVGTDGALDLSLCDHALETSPVQGFYSLSTVRTDQVLKLCNKKPECLQAVSGYLTPNPHTCQQITSCTYPPSRFLNVFY